jgi:hypothetical protein
MGPVDMNELVGVRDGVDGADGAVRIDVEDHDREWNAV